MYNKKLSKYTLDSSRNIFVAILKLNFLDIHLEISIY